MGRIPRSSWVFSYSAEHEPAARLAPGDTVVVETTNAFGDQSFKPGDTLADLDLEQADPLTGPLYVEGAAPGDTLAVSIEHIEPIGTGASYGGSRPSVAPSGSVLRQRRGLNRRLVRSALRVAKPPVRKPAGEPSD